MKKTKIVCTIGPASEDVSTLKELIKNGMNVARLNFSHGSHEEHAQRIESIRKAASDVGVDVAIMLDTKGPEIRLGEIPEGKVILEAGDKITLTVAPCQGTAQRVQVSYEGLIDDVKIGDNILIDDGLVGLEVECIEGEDVHCVVVNGGEISGRKGVNVPGVDINLPALTEKDISDLHFGIDQGVDFIAASFIRKPSDVLEIKEILEERGADIHVISKVENQAGVDNIDGIINVSDGLMVARGDLGVEIPAEEVPLAQKMMIEKCNREAKPVITATQMLDSMMRNPRPTRAEASDVANAIFDGTDAIMLSGETAAGKYPLEAVKTMTKIAIRAEGALKDRRQKEHQQLEKSVTDAIGFATKRIAQDLGAAAVITSTKSGSTAKVVSKCRPESSIIAATPSKEVARKLQLVWGVQSILVTETDSTDEMFRESVVESLSAGLIETGDLVVITAGVPAGVSGNTNLIKVHIVGEILAKGTGIGKGCVSGKIIKVNSAADLEKVEDSSILLTSMTDKEAVPAMNKAAAIVTEVGGITSHAAIVGISIGKPVIIGIGDSGSKFSDGMVVTLDVNRGLIYEGVAKVV
ncbi:pyruvate kinase [Desulfitispora alkaliphila]|uniref:pyruvate kinase n=1 Tax=Desulfitispora alkaliphila TaxID=622674 RepID=UPI003D1997F1